MQGTLARAWEGNNSSFIWGLLVGSSRQGLFLHWISATVLLPVPDTGLPWLPCRAGLLGGEEGWQLEFLVLPVHPRDSLRQLSSTPNQPCGNPVFRAGELSLCPPDLAQKPPPPGRLSVHSPWAQLLEHMTQQGQPDIFQYF